MNIPLFHVDAFTGRVFAGNPAAVCPLETWPDDATLQQIAAENNLSEPAFFAPEGDALRLRWFTPEVEVDLCGHATLASAFVIMNYLEPGRAEVRFLSASGELRVEKSGDLYTLDFPSRPPEPCSVPKEIAAAMGKAPVDLLASRDYLAVYESEDDVRGLVPDMEALKSLDRFAVIATAPGSSVDFVSRFFAPAQGIAEDPVTGSAHCTLTPYWSRRLGKTQLHALQVSRRGGELWCEDRGARVHISGKAALFSRGLICL